MVVIMIRYLIKCITFGKSVWFNNARWCNYAVTNGGSANEGLLFWLKYNKVWFVRVFASYLFQNCFCWLCKIPVFHCFVIVTKPLLPFSNAVEALQICGNVLVSSCFGVGILLIFRSKATLILCVDTHLVAWTMAVHVLGPSAFIKLRILNGGDRAEI